MKKMNKTTIIGVVLMVFGVFFGFCSINPFYNMTENIVIFYFTACVLSWLFGFMFVMIGGNK